MRGKKNKKKKTVTHYLDGYRVEIIFSREAKLKVYCKKDSGT